MAKDPTNPIGTFQWPLGRYTESAREILDLLGAHFPGYITRDDYADIQDSLVSYSRFRAARQD